MKKRFFTSQFLGFFIVSALGVLLHFLYEWTGESLLVASFSGVNESTWEHMKLFFFPAFLYAVFQSFFFKDSDNFWLIKLKGTSVGLLLIPIIFYTYNGVIGKSPDWFNVAIFFISAGLCYLYEGKLLKNVNSKKFNLNTPSIIAFCIIAFAFILFTFATPCLNIFKDPISGQFGL